FAVAQPDETHFDFTVGIVDVAHGISHQPNHATRQIHDPHRIAHVEDEYIAAPIHRARLQHQLRSLGNRHEVTLHVRVRHGHRTTALDLLLEQGHDRA